MKSRSHDGQPPALGALLRELAEGSGDLVRQEVRLARIEVTEFSAGIAKGTGFIVAGGVLLLLGGLATLTGLVMLGGDQWLRDRYWLAALIVFVIAGALAAWFASRGVSRLSLRQLAPDETIATLKEDSAWVKQQLTSSGTSR